MSLPKCKHCGNQFRWKTIIKTIWRYKPISCVNCNTLHEITFLSRVFLSCLTSLIPFVFMCTYGKYFISNFYSIGTGWIWMIALLSLLIWSIVSILITPFFVKYKKFM